MNISRQRHHDVETISVQGRFEFSAHRGFADAVKAAVDHAPTREIHIDLQAVDYIDSAALGMLLLAREKTQAGGKSIALSGAQGYVKQVLEIASFGKLFTITPAAH